MSSARAFLEEYRPNTIDDVCGNYDAKRMMRRWLTGMGVPRCVLFTGESGSGKTTMARILAASAVCQNRVPENPDPCGRPDCVCDAIQRYLFMGRGAIVRNGVDLSVETVKSDFGNLYYAEPNWPLIFYYDEIHRAVPRARDLLLTKVEEFKDEFNFVLIASTWNLEGVEDAFVKRFVRVETQAPTEGEVVTMLRRMCTKESFPFDDAALVEIARSEYCVPRNCYNELWARASKL